ncbi:MAG: FCD domain-containing protein [Polynucleobacter sp.]|nr:MAG: FCD domain-containing protein [Polynucleobacter sp.]
MHLVPQSSFVPKAPEPKTLVEGAYLALRRDIINGVHPPSTKLRVEHLKDRYNVGAGTLREALALLVADSLVFTQGQKGFTVSPMSLADFLDITEMRVMLEMEALSQSMRSGTDKWEADVIAAYHRLTLAEKKLGKTDDSQEDNFFHEWEQRNEEFHSALVSACPSKWILQFIGIIYHHSERYRRIAMHYRKDNERDVHAEHEALKTAALNRDIKLCTKLLGQHIKLTYDLVSKLPESIFSQKTA